MASNEASDGSDAAKVTVATESFLQRVRSIGSTKESKIVIFIAIDLIFFLLELVVGYSAHSLALVADAFHMLNDIISLFVGLWAVRVAKRGETSNEYTYGWARAELLGGLMNGVFLVALCLSIFLESIQRFVEPQKVKNPKVVFIVGAVGLAFNIIGLFVFHQHGHSHGEGSEHEHNHSHVDPLSSAEHGHTSHARSISFQVGGENGQDGQTARSAPRGSFTGRVRTGSHGQGIDFSTHPSSIRNSISLRAAQMAEPSDTDTETVSGDEAEEAPTDQTPLLAKSQKSPSKSPQKASKSRNVHEGHNGKIVDHTEHNHAQPKSGPKGGHAHGDMNIRGIFLHVLGDALGNIGVMASALIIWRTNWPGKNYSDPAISLIITAILLKTAIPLCRDTAKPLLQATPQHISVKEIKDDISSLPGVDSCHHVHVWALTPTKYIATLDVRLSFDFDKENSARYMDIAKEIKHCLHGYGIHSSTVQPEFIQPGHRGQYHAHLSSSQPLGENNTALDREDGACLLNCDDECDTGRQCCGPGQKHASGTSSPGH